MDGWGEFIQTVSIAVTAYFAVAGLRAWRIQMLGKRRFEIAEEAVLAAHRVKESLRFIRTPGSMGEETEGRQRSSDETPEQGRWYDTYFIIFAREEVVREDFAQLAKSRLLCRAHFGEDAVKPFDDLLAVRAKVLAYAVRLMSLESTQALAYSELPKLQGVVLGNQDAIAAAVDDAVSRIETICRPFLNAPDDSVLWRKVWNRAKCPRQGGRQIVQQQGTRSPHERPV
jgi:hypothetical protein